MELQDPVSAFDVATPAPPVLAVLVRHASGDGATFQPCLEALAAQDYPDLRVVVVDTSGDADLAELVHEVLPEATVHQMVGDTGFGAAANVVLADDGHDIPYFLFCHDDVAPEPAATRGLVAAAQTWHAAVVGPKLVAWDDPRRLRQVGEAVTKTGVTVPLVEPDELDQGQHDIVQEAFTVPGAFTLVRADVFRSIGGFDEDIVLLADDLSLCWRARLAGARVVVEPSVRVRHRAALAERLPARQRQRLLARHRLRVVLTSYATPDLLRIAPQAALASVVEALVALLTFRPSRARAALAAWHWNLGRLGSLRRLRRQVQELRQVDDQAIRHLQAPGLIRPQLRQWRSVAGGTAPRPGPPTGSDETSPAEAAADGSADETGPVTGAEAGGADPADDGAVLHDAGEQPEGDADDGGGALDTWRDWRVSLADRLESLRTGWTSGGVIVLLALAGTLVLGSRHVVTRGIPVVGELARFGPPGELLDEWRSGWRPTGVGSEQAAPTALAALAALGRLVAGHMDLLRLVLTLGLIPVGIAGAFRLLRPSGSARAPVAAAVAYACVPVPYAALAQGRWAPLAVYAAAPWLLAQLARAAATPPFGGAVPSPVRQMVRLGLLTALLGMVVPLAPLLLLGLTVAVLLGGLLAFEPRGGLRLATLGAGGAVVATVLHVPWSFELVRSWWPGARAPSGPAAWLGLVQGGPSSPHPLDLLSAGAEAAPVALWWALPAAGALVLLVGRQWRLSWGIRGWTVALSGWGAAWAASGAAPGAGQALPAPDVLLALAGAGVALAVGMGVAAVELDVAGRSRRFGLRRTATALALVALGLATLPVLRGSLDGYWGMPDGDFTGLLDDVEEDTSAAASRVLWLGDPALLPAPGWPVPGDTARPLVYATTQGLPTVADLWPGRLEAPTGQLGDAVQLAIARQTARLGGLLAPMAVEYVAVPQGLAPASYRGERHPAPAELTAALDGQLDLERVDVDPSLLLYRNTASLPGRAVVDPGAKALFEVDPAHATPSQLRQIAALDAEPVLTSDGADRAAGDLPDGGVLFQATPPSDRWHLDVGDTELQPQPAFGWASRFPVIDGGTASLSYDTPPSRHLALVLQVALWLVTVAMALAPAGARARRRQRQTERRARRAARRQSRHLARIQRRTTSSAGEPVEIPDPLGDTAGPPAPGQPVDDQPDDDQPVDDQPDDDQPDEPAAESVRVVADGERTPVDAAHP